MVIGFRNINELWASVFTETLKRLGLNCAVICPGSRSTPVSVDFAESPDIEVIPILDERSAAFFALGKAKGCKRIVNVLSPSRKSNVSLNQVQCPKLSLVSYNSTTSSLAHRPIAPLRQLLTGNVNKDEPNCRHGAVY